MKRLAPLALVAALATSGCYGSWSAAGSVHRWNGHVTSTRWLNSLIHFGLFIVPVYEVVAVGDLLVFNTVEFITKKPVFGGGAAPATSTPP